MYRKILFLSVGVVEKITILSKSTILLAFSFISCLFTIICKPFILREFNSLEIFSNLSTLITIYSGSLYILDITDFFKVLTFFIIVLVNTIFALRWLWSMFEIVFNIHFDFFEKYCPEFSKKYLMLNQNLKNQKFDWNLFKYASKIYNNSMGNSEKNESPSHTETKTHINDDRNEIESKINKVRNLKTRIIKIS